VSFPSPPFKKSFPSRPPQRIVAGESRQEVGIAVALDDVVELRADDYVDTLLVRTPEGDMALR
jgi:hypothetical protein